MSRIGKKPIEIPAEATVKILENKVVVNGPKGKLEQKIPAKIKVKLKDKQIIVERQTESKAVKSLHGLIRMLIANMIEGVINGYTKTLEMHGTGYKVFLEENNLKILVGFSHSVKVEPPEGIKFQVEENNIIKVLGIDKQLVGQTAASIRDIKKPEPYKGKGICYQGEKIRRKAGKSAKAVSSEGA